MAGAPPRQSGPGRGPAAQARDRPRRGPGRDRGPGRPDRAPPGREGRKRWREGGRNPEGAEDAPPHGPAGQGTTARGAWRAGERGRAIGEGEPASEDGGNPAGRSPRTKKARPRAGATERRGQAPPKRPPGSAQIKARPTGRGYRLVAEGGTAGGLPCPRGPGDGRGGRAAPPPEGDLSVARSAAQGARISAPPQIGRCILPFHPVYTLPSVGQDMSIDTYTYLVYT